MSVNKVVIMRGIPGSGKSTYVESMGDDVQVVVSADHHFTDAEGNYNFNPAELPAAHQACFRAFTCGLNLQDEADNEGSDLTVVVDNTNTSLWEMSPYVLAAESAGFEVEIVHVTCDPETAAARNTHGVPAEAVARMAESFEEPLPWWNSSVIRIERRGRGKYFTEVKGL